MSHKIENPLDMCDCNVIHTDIVDQGASADAR